MQKLLSWGDLMFDAGEEWIKVAMSQGPHPMASPLQESCPLTFPWYSQDVMLLLFKKIKAQKKSKYIRGSPQSPYCGSINTWGLGNSQLRASPQVNYWVDLETQNAILTTETRHLHSPGGKYMVIFAFVVSHRFYYITKTSFYFYFLVVKPWTSHVMKELYH